MQCENLHSANQPLCQAISVAVILFEVVAKVLILATNFLRFCRAGSVNGMTFAEGVSGVCCAVGRIYTGFGSREGTSGIGLFWMRQ